MSTPTASDRFQICATPYERKEWEVYDARTGETVFTCNTRALASAMANRRNEKEKIV